MPASLQHLVLLLALVSQIAIPALTVLGPSRTDAIVPSAVSSSISSIEAKIPFVSFQGSVTTETKNAPAVEAPARTFPVIAALWLFVVAALAAWMAYGRIYMKRVARNLQPERNGPLASLLDEVSREHHVTRPVSLLVGGPFFVPVTWGIIYPVILFPNDARGWPAARARLAMLHELAHVRRLDPLAHLLAWSICAMTWFNPLVWIALRRLKSAAERAADDAVLVAGVRPSTYVDTLVEMMKRLGSEPLQIRSTFAMARRGEFEHRMLAVLNENAARRARLPGFLVCSMAFVVAIATLGLAARPATAIGAANTTASTSSGVSAWLKVAEQAPGDPARVDPLRSAIAAGPMTSGEVDRYLAIASGISNPIARSEAIRILVEAMALHQSAVSKSIEVVGGISKPIPASVALIAVAKTQQLSASDRDLYFSIASKLEGPPLTSALEALR